MKLTWLHISDIHLRGGDRYEADVMLNALVASVRRYRRERRAPDLLFVTGDIAFSGKPDEYRLATRFFDDLLMAADLPRRRLFVVPGNHDVDREAGRWLARTLSSGEDAEAFFAPGAQQPHLTQKQQGFIAWHNEYFREIRSHPLDASYGSVEAIEVGGCRVGILPLNSALFSQDDHDHGKLWLGRGTVDAALTKLDELKPKLKIALVHHPLDWLHEAERVSIRNTLQKNLDLILRGHLHDNEAVVEQNGLIQIAAGAAYETRRWPNRALYGSFDGEQISLFPIRYEDAPQPVWTVDPSLWPDQPNFTRSFPIRLAAATAERVLLEEPALPRTRSNIRSRLGVPFVGRKTLLNTIRAKLGDPIREAVVVLKGQPGVGKSELAREFARQHAQRYPGGTFFIDASGGGLPLDLIQIGTTQLGLPAAQGLSLEEQCLQTLYALGRHPTLLIYDNVPSPEAIERWLPPAGMPCHVLITSLADRWDAGWNPLEVKPLRRPDAMELITALAGSAIAESHGKALAEMADGLPVQLCPAAASLALADRRGRLQSVALTLTDQAHSSFRMAWEQLGPDEHLLLQAAAFLNGQQILASELFAHLRDGAGWSEAECQRRLDGCLDLHLLEGTQELRMHQLLGRFVLVQKPKSPRRLKRVRKAQWNALVSVAKDLLENPADRGLAARVKVYPLSPAAWEKAGVAVPAEVAEGLGRSLIKIGLFAEALGWYVRAVFQREQSGADGQSLNSSLHQVGFCLSEMGKHEEALDWFQSAVKAKQKGDSDGRIDHDSLGRSLHQVGICLSRMGKFEDAMVWYQRGVEAGQKGDAHGRVDHESLGHGLHQVGICLSLMGRHAEALGWYQRAVEAGQKGDVNGRIDPDSLGKSLHHVGFCLSRMGKVDQALDWYQRAVEAKQKGDLYGRIDHESLGKSLHAGGICLADLGRLEEALDWFRRAVAASEQGDLFGRIDPESLGISLEAVATCLDELGRPEEAEAWRARAAELKPEG